jgi:hypothetical protein
MSKRKTSGGDYQVGYRRPPKAHQFQKGAPSANPAGRPKKARTPDIRSTDAFHQLVLKEAAAEITVIEAGKENLHDAARFQRRDRWACGGSSRGL